MANMQKKNVDDRGFTLVELMIAMAMAGIVAAAILMSFNSQSKTQVSQQLVVEMQQDLRAALYLMQQDVRMAGHDPSWVDGNADGVDDNRLADGSDNDCDTNADGADPDEANDISGVLVAGPHTIQVRMDIDNDVSDNIADGDFCDPNELVAYGLAVDTATIDGDGIADSGATDLRRSSDAGGLQVLAGSIQAVAFGYAFDDDLGAATTDGVVDTNGNNIIWAYDSDGNGDLDRLLDSNNDGAITEADDLNGDGWINDVALAPAVPVNRIRAVRVWILGRTRAPLRDYRDNETYVVGNKILTPGDTFKRELLATSMNCRNLGLR
jgi:type IV pilus assembly protein PilW